MSSNDDVLAALERLERKLDDHMREDAENFSRLLTADDQIRDEVQELRSQVKMALAACRKAANATVEQRALLDRSMREIRVELERQTTELLRLIGSDSLQEEKIAAVEKATQAVTEKALSQITKQADKASKGISMKVSIPVGVITATIGLIQFLLAHWLK